jgi:hypothetical protein
LKRFRESSLRPFALDCYDAEDLIVLGQKRLGPRGAEPMCERNMAPLRAHTRPQRIGGDIGDDDPLLPKGRRTTGAHVLADQQRAYGLDESGGHAGGSHGPQPQTVGIHQHHDRHHVRVLLINGDAKSCEDVRQAGTGGDHFQDLLGRRQE